MTIAAVSDAWDLYNEDAPPSWRDTVMPDYNGLTPSLEHYDGRTGVKLPESERNLIDLVNSLVTGQYGNYRQLLSGTPDYGLLDLAILNPMRQDLQNYILPGIKDAYSGGVYGGENYWSGARQGAEERAYYDTFKNINLERYKASENAKIQSLQAAGLLPSFMQIEDIERQNQIQNLERAINIHYKNQGLTQQDIQNDLAAQQMAIQQYLGEAGMAQRDSEMFNQLFFNLRDQGQEEVMRSAQVNAYNDSTGGNSWGQIGGQLLGGVGGYFISGGNPMGAMIGSQIGGSLGGAAFGGQQGVAGAAQGLQSSINTIGSYYMMQNLMDDYRLDLQASRTTPYWDPEVYSGGGYYPSKSVLSSS